MIEVTDLQKRISYDPLTGLFVRLFQSDMPKKINTRFAGRLTGTDNGHGYIVITVLYTSYLAHRLAWALSHGYFPEQFVDHINGNGRDNRLENLRLVDCQQSVRNRGPLKTNKVGCNGVRQVADGKWRATIMVDRQHINLGRFFTCDEAINARKQAEIVYFGSYRRIPALREAVALLNGGAK